MEENKELIYNKAKGWQIVAWPLSEGVVNMFLVLMMFASYLAAGGYGIAVTLAGSIITGTRIFDGITDPIIAIATERFNTKHGKVRILMLMGYTVMSVSIFALFFWGIGHGILWFTTGYIFYIIGYTIFNVTRSIGVSIITNDPKQRPKLYRWSTIYSMTIGALTSVYLSKILAPKYGGLKVEAFQEMAITVIIAGFILTLIACIAISSKDTEEAFANAKKKDPVKFKDAIMLIKNNKAMQMYIVAGASDKLALQAASQSAITTLVFGIIINNYGFSGTLNMINLIPIYIVVFSITSIAGKVGTKKALVNMTTISIILAVAMVVYMILIDPTKISVNTVPTVVFIGLNALFAAAKAGTSACAGAMIPDIIDYEKYRSGNYMPAVVGAVYSFIDKMISSFASTIVAFAIAAIGYTQAMPQPGDPTSPALFNMTMFLWMGLPIIGWACTLIAMKWYPLDKEMMVEVQTKNSQN